MSDLWDSLSDFTKGFLFVINSTLWFVAGWRIREATDPTSEQEVPL